MEYKIGQVFEVERKWYQFVECNGTSCNNCVFNKGLKCRHPDISMQCARFFRTDGKNGHVVLLDAIGDVYEQGGAIWQQYKCVEKPNTEDKRVYIAYTDSEVGLIVSIRLTSSNDMENNEKHSNSENIGKNLKPFDLQAAKSGKPICTRDGRKARIICFDRKDIKPIVALVTSINGDNINEKAFYYFESGHHLSKYDNNINDLMMLPEKKEGWVNVSKFRIYASKEEALSHKTYDIIDTIKVSWEE